MNPELYKTAGGGGGVEKRVDSYYGVLSLEL